MPIHAKNLSLKFVILKMIWTNLIAVWAIFQVLKIR